MLSALLEYADRHHLVAEPGFAAKTVKWALDIDSGSTDVDVNEVGNLEQKRNPGRVFPAAPELTQGELIAGGETRAHFLADTADVVALHLKPNATERDRTKAEAKHEYFVTLLERASHAVPALASVAALLRSPDTLSAIREQLVEKRAKPTDRVTFFLDAEFILESDAWHGWWRDFRRELTDEAPSPDRVCLLTGELAPPIRTQPKIVGLADVGGLPTGDALASFNKESFRSLGLEEGENAAMSEAAFTRCRSALNQLIRDSSHRFPGVRVVHWYKTPVDVDPVAQLNDGEEDAAQATARKLLDAIDTGVTVPHVGNRYHVLSVSGAAGRVMVRDYDEGPFENLQLRVRQWFEDVAIVHREGGRLARHPKFLGVAGACVRDLNELEAPLLVGLWRAALGGRAWPIPVQAHHRALHRTRLDIVTDQPLRHPRFGLLKAFHNRRNPGGPTMEPYLNPAHPDAAYHCGRLMAVLAGLQHAALGDVGAGVVQRYYLSASQAPKLRFGLLLNNAKNHLQKLEGGLPDFFEQKIAEVMGCIGDRFPDSLSLEGQSLFALGYYQQLAHDRHDRSQKAEARRAANASTES